VIYCRSTVCCTERLSLFLVPSRFTFDFCERVERRRDRFGGRRSDSSSARNGGGGTFYIRMRLSSSFLYSASDSDCVVRNARPSTSADPQEGKIETGNTIGRFPSHPFPAQDLVLTIELPPQQVLDTLPTYPLGHICGWV
jgi:hypothetical protein